jgi:hypothetical protein
MAEKDERRVYRSFLLRMWRNSDSAWRFSVEDTVTENREGFASLGLLIDFLLDRIQSDDQPEEDNHEFK